MLLTLTQFQALPYVNQLEALLKAGIYLATHYEQADMINLYALENFFIEVHYDLLTNYLYKYHSLTKTDDLMAYLSAL